MFKKINSKGQYSPVAAMVDSQDQVVLSGSPTASALNITVPTVIKAAPGRIVQINVVVAGSAAGTVNDVITTGAAAAANQVATIPVGVANLPVNFPCLAGIVVVPGTGQTLAVSYN